MWSKERSVGSLPLLPPQGDISPLQKRGEVESGLVK